VVQSKNRRELSASEWAEKLGGLGSLRAAMKANRPAQSEAKDQVGKKEEVAFEAEKQKRQLRAADARISEIEQLISGRSWLSKTVCGIVVFWLTLVLMTVWSQAFAISVTVWGVTIGTTGRLSDAVMITLITTTTADVLALLATVLLYFFAAKRLQSAAGRLQKQAKKADAG